jgi:hypothetical protein
MDWRRNKASKEEGGLRVEEEDVGVALRGLGEEGVDAAATNHNYHRLCQSQVVSMQYLVAQTYLAASILGTSLSLPHAGGGGSGGERARRWWARETTERRVGSDLPWNHADLPWLEILLP